MGPLLLQRQLWTLLRNPACLQPIRFIIDFYEKCFLNGLLGILTHRRWPFYCSVICMFYFQHKTTKIKFRKVGEWFVFNPPTQLLLFLFDLNVFFAPIKDMFRQTAEAKPGSLSSLPAGDWSLETSVKIDPWPKLVGYLTPEQFSTAASEVIFMAFLPLHTECQMRIAAM